MKITFRYPTLMDIDDIMLIERSGFSAEEAASEVAMLERIKIINDTFILAIVDQKVAGFVVGPVIPERHLRDELYEKVVSNPDNGGYQSVLSIAVHPDYRQMGIGSAMLNHLKEQATDQNRLAITLTCLEDRIPFYEKHGFINEGISTSEHAKERWYNMVCEL